MNSCGALIRLVDFRKGMAGLAALVYHAIGADPFSGTVYVFRSKRADWVKLLVWDGSGLVLAVKRLEAGQFCWPKIEDGVVRLSAALSAGVEYWFFRTSCGEVCRPA
ncbi:IS66 family insertion sequence element accessory protein TnpB [Methylobacterium fujisawaense]